MISLVSLAVAALIVAIIARKVYINRKAAMTGSKSLSDQSAEDSMDPSTEPGTEPGSDNVVTAI
jgi:flagellar biosynthesis/type III secretory pathway M-ring protein FliF/YscJ